jgi:hypothetical protein
MTCDYDVTNCLTVDDQGRVSDDLMVDGQTDPRWTDRSKKNLHIVDELLQCSHHFSILLYLVACYFAYYRSTNRKVDRL